MDDRGQGLASGKTDTGWLNKGRQTISDFVNWFLARRQGADIYDDEKTELNPQSCCHNDSFAGQLPINKRQYGEGGGQTPLTAAIRSRDLEHVTRLLQIPEVDVNFPEVAMYSAYSTVMQTPLCVATKLQDFDIIKLLLEAGAKVNIPTTVGYSAIYIAAETGNEDCVSLLLQYKPCLSSSFHLDDPVHVACRHGHMGVVKLLIEAGCDPDPKKIAAIISPLQLTINHGHEDLALCLLQNGVQYEPTSNCRPNVGTLLHACWSGCDRVVEYLINTGVDINMASSDGISHFFYAIRSGDLARLAREGKGCYGDVVRLRKVYEDFREVFRQSVTVINILCQSGGLFEQSMGVSRLTPLCQSLKDFNIPVSILLLKHGAQWDDTCDYIFERNRLRKLKDIDQYLYAAMVLLMDNKRRLFFQRRQPMSVSTLKQSCRRSIRTSIIRNRNDKVSIMPLIRTLHLPKLLLDYLCFSEINLDQIVPNLSDTFFNHITTSL